MQTSLYEITFKDGRMFRVFCANRKQNKDILYFLSARQSEIKKDGQVVVSVGIHTMPQFKKIMDFK